VIRGNQASLFRPILGNLDSDLFSCRAGVWMGIGTAEGTGMKSLREALDKAGVKNVYFESEGTAHEWLTWRRCLNDFAPRLFR
jgi:S-formylglutathione hydrolase FrmB